MSLPWNSAAHWATSLDGLERDPGPHYRGRRSSSARSSRLSSMRNELVLDMHSSVLDERGTALRARLAVTVLLIAICAALQPSVATAASPPASALGKRYQDGLDSRYAAQRLAQATSSVGYAGTAYTAGRSASSSWADGLESSVFGFFGHANGGIAQVNDAPDQILAAGTSADIEDSTFSYWSNYLPFVDVDDMKLAVFAGCYTANRDLYFGSFGEMGRERGVDSVVGFTGLVLFPANCVNCNYSGNYYWDRFSTYAQAGDTVGTALSKARADLVAAEGNAGGWDAWRVQGAVRSPLDVRITPAGWGQPLDSKVLGIDPFEPFSLNVTSAKPVSVGSVSYTEYTTTEGVSYRRDPASGELAWMSAPASTLGESGFSEEQALDIAGSFAQSHLDYFDHAFELVGRARVSHAPGNELVEFTWRPLAQGVYGPASVTVAIDLRKGSVVDFAATLHRPSTTRLEVSKEQAIETVLRRTGSGHVVSAQADLWTGPRWTVTVDRGTRGRFRDLSEFVVDGSSGELVTEAKT